MAITVFSTKPRDAEAKAIINEAKTLASLDVAEAAWRATQPDAPSPVITEHPIDDSVQTGDSRLLGGPMEIKSPWSQE